MIASALRRWSRDPVFLLGLFAGLLAFVIQSGELGTSDTTHRLQTAHSFWTDEPAVSPGDYPEFGVHGRDGKLQSWYGIGQSLLMLPADVVGTYIAKLSVFANYEDDPSVKNIIVSYSTSTLLSVLTALVCFRFLRQFDFDTKQSVIGVLALLLATSHLHYTQNMMENNYIFLLTLTGFCWQYDWWLTGRRKSLWIGCGAFGLNLLTRLTTGLDLLAGAFFLLLLAWLEEGDRKTLWNKCRVYVATALPVYALFGFLDRLYQYHRFGSFFSNYMSISSAEQRVLDPSLPANYPFSTPFHVGFLGPFITPEKSIFLFDPLLLLMILLSLVAWKHFSPAARAYAIATSLLLLAHICFYARFATWSGDSAWGDRYVSTTVEFVVLLAIPLLLRHRHQLGKWVWAPGLGLLTVSTLVQLASLAFWLPLELYQMEAFNRPTVVVVLRIRNIIAFAIGKMDAWGLNTPSLTEDPWDYAHISTWNFLPFLLRRVGEVPAWVVHLAFAIWGAGLTALAATLARLRWIFVDANETSLREHTNERMVTELSQRGARR